MLQLLAALGVGSIIAVFIQAQISISNHRQAWINALRDDIAVFLKELEVIHYAVGDTFNKPDQPRPILEDRKRDARIGVLFVYRRIILRLNAKEDLHK